MVLPYLLDPSSWYWDQLQPSRNKQFIDDMKNIENEIMEPELGESELEEETRSPGEVPEHLKYASTWNKKITLAGDKDELKLNVTI